MSTPSINLGICSSGKELIKNIDSHFKNHEPQLYFLSSSLTIKNDGSFDLESVVNDEVTTSSNALIKPWFEYDLYAEIKNLINIVNDVVNDTINLNIIVPVYEEKSIHLLSQLLVSIKELTEDELVSGLKIRIFSVIHPPIDIKLHNQKPIKDQLKELDNLSEKFNHLINDVFYLDDRTISQVHLNFSTKWMAFALGEFFIFQMLDGFGSLAITNKNKVFGLGVIHFNEVLFRSVISNTILQYKFKDEGINDDQAIQIQDVINKCNPFIQQHQNFFDTFIEKYPFSEENDKNLNQNSKNYVDELKKNLNNFITNNENNLVESKAILANLLGEDDKKLEGVIWKNQRLNLRDLELDIINYFNDFLNDKDQVDITKQKELKEKITDLKNGIKKDTESIKIIDENSDNIHKDLEISFENGIFSVDGKRINASGYIPSEIDSNTAIYAYEEKIIPERIDLSNYLSLVKNQGELGSCTAFPIAAIYEFAAIQNHTKVNISELFIYYNSREIRGNILGDTGASLLDAINAVKEYGACHTSTYPYDIDQFAIKPHESAYIEAKHQIVENAFRVYLVEDDFKHAIANGHLIIIGLKVFESFYPRDNSGIVPYPGKEEAMLENHGRHAMLIVGYNDNDKLFKVRNSWGPQFGDNGYCYIPYDYILNADFCTEAYVITKIVDLSYDEFNYDSVADFSFLKDTLIRKKNIIEYNLRNKQKQLSEVKKLYELEALQNEYNIEQIKNPIFRKKIYNELKNTAQVKTPTPPPPLEQPKKKNIQPWLFTIGGIILIIISSLLFPVITIIGTIIGVIVGLILLFWGIFKLTNPNKKIKTQSQRIVETSFQVTDSNKEKLYKFMVADGLFKSFDEMEKDLIKRYKAISRYFEKIKKWQETSLEKLHNIDYSSPTFVFNIIKEKPLLDYIHNKKDEFLKNLRNLSDDFHLNFQPDKNNENEIFENIHKSYLSDIKINTDEIIDISIIDYLFKKKDYPFFNPPPPIKKIIKYSEKVSKPFCNLKVNAAALEIQNFEIKEILNTNNNDIEDQLTKHRGASNNPIKIERFNNRKKFVTIQVAALNDIKDLVRY